MKHKIRRGERGKRKRFEGFDRDEEPMFRPFTMPTLGKTVAKRRAARKQRRETRRRQRAS